MKNVIRSLFWIFVLMSFVLTAYAHCPRKHRHKPRRHYCHSAPRCCSPIISVYHYWPPCPTCSCSGGGEWIAENYDDCGNSYAVVYNQFNMGPDSCGGDGGCDGGMITYNPDLATADDDALYDPNLNIDR